MYMQRYVERFPAGGEIVIFDRSWYNRAGVEYVMGFRTPEQHQRFLELCPVVERFIVDGGVRLIKNWLEVGQEEQERRFMARIDDPMIVRSDNKRRARLNAIAHILSQIPYKKIDKPKVQPPPRSTKRQYDDRATLEGRRFVVEQC